MVELELVAEYIDVGLQVCTEIRVSSLVGFFDAFLYTFSVSLNHLSSNACLAFNFLVSISSSMVFWRRTSKSFFNMVGKGSEAFFGRRSGGVLGTPLGTSLSRLR